jgi:hypothetical protein
MSYAANLTCPATPIAVDGIRPDTRFHVVTHLTGDEWDEAVALFEDTYYDQTHTFRGAGWSHDRVRRVAVIRNGEIVAMAIAVVIKLPIINRGLAHVKFAPLWRRKNRPANTDDFRLAIEVLKDEFTVKEKFSLIIMPPPDPRFAHLYDRELRSVGFRHYPYDDPERYFVDTTFSADRQLKSLDQKWRYNLKKAQAQNLLISVEHSEQSLASFRELFGQMERRKKYSNPSWPVFYQALCANGPASIRPSLVLARENGKPIAGAIIGQIGDTAYYLYGATSDRATELKAGYALHWWITLWLNRKGARWYDLGGALGEKGLRQFKKGLVGKDGEIANLPGQYLFARDPLSGSFAACLLQVRRTRLWLKIRADQFKQRIRDTYRRPSLPKKPPPCFP